MKNEMDKPNQIRKLELRQDGAGQWMYQLLQGERVHVNWQYGSFDRAETVEQAQGRFGQDYIVMNDYSNE